jgi:hypothetical protein
MSRIEKALEKAVELRQSITKNVREQRRDFIMVSLNLKKFLCALCGSFVVSLCSLW